jgi:hypothetical protein
MYVHWNSIRSAGGKYIFEGLKENLFLKVIDLSDNSMGIGQPCCVNNVVEFLLSNKSMVHMDLSNNAFNLDDSIKISEALDLNHTLIGFHF